MRAPKQVQEAHSDANQPAVETDIPARLDRLSWHRFHSLIVAALGITWILDGLEVTLAGSISSALKSSPSLHLTDAQIGISASAYLIGAVAGALIFGRLADTYGRKRLFNVTLGVYLVATALTACSTNLATFAFFRALTGAGIGGEYSAINSAIQEWIPARYRGRTDLLVNGSYWIGAALGASGAVVLLRPGVLPDDYGWRAAFGIGAILGLMILVVRRYIPESPRWLMTHGGLEKANSITEAVERRCGVTSSGAYERIRLQKRSINTLTMLRTLYLEYPSRSVYCLVLMIAQAFFYNAIFFTYALVLSRFFQTPDDRIGLYILPFAAGNFLGPLLLGPLFDTIGRKKMIVTTYALSGGLLAIVALLFVKGMLTATTQTVAWSVVFFFASSAASAAYLTVGESFPLEMRAFAIAVFYALGTALGGVVAPALFGILIGTGEPIAVASGYILGSLLMLAAAAVALKLGIAAERRSLEDIAPPFSSSQSES
jgi:MFS family permease